MKLKQDVILKIKFLNIYNRGFLMAGTCKILDKVNVCLGERILE